MPSSLLFIMVGSSLGARMGEHCEYVDLCAVGTKEESTCRVGQKFLLKGQKESGVRRQFLITNSTNMVAFLTRGEKAVECGQSLVDITSALTCKDVEGVSELLLNIQSSKSRKGGRRKRRKRKKGSASRRPKKRAAVRGRHCDFIHLCGIGREEGGSGCRLGDKFLVQGEPGVRRQFLMAPGSNIVIFLSRGKKVTSCYGQGWSILTDISQKVTCKPVAGLESLSVETGLATGTTTATSIPDLLPYTPPLVCPCRPPYNNTWNPSTGRCVVKIESTHDSHSVICNGETTKVPCGADIKANGDLYSHPLCSSNGYLTVGDLTWQCSDLTVPAAQDCSLTPR